MTIQSIHLHTVTHMNPADVNNRHAGELPDQDVWRASERGEGERGR